MTKASTDTLITVNCTASENYTAEIAEHKRNSGSKRPTNLGWEWRRKYSNYCNPQFILWFQSFQYTLPGIYVLMSLVENIPKEVRAAKSGRELLQENPLRAGFFFSFFEEVLLFVDTYRDTYSPVRITIPLLLQYTYLQ